MGSGGTDEQRKVWLEEQREGGRRMRYPFGARLFARVFGRHLRQGHNADYEVCSHWLCWLAWRLEHWMWYR